MKQTIFIFALSLCTVFVNTCFSQCQCGNNSFRRMSQSNNGNGWQQPQYQQPQSTQDFYTGDMNGQTAPYGQVYIQPSYGGYNSYNEWAVNSPVIQNWPSQPINTFQQNQGGYTSNGGRNYEENSTQNQGWNSQNSDPNYGMLRLNNSQNYDPYQNQGWNNQNYDPYQNVNYRPNQGNSFQNAPSRNPQNQGTIYVDGDNRSRQQRTIKTLVTIVDAFGTVLKSYYE